MNGQPAPVAPGFFVTGGTLRLDALCYVEREADHELLDGLLRGEFCYVLTSRQMGKSSLMVRAAAKLREQGAHVIALDLAGIGQNLSAEQWYTGLLAGIGRQLRLEDELEAFWDAHARLSPVQRLFAALRDVALARREGRLVVFVDELDVVRSLPFGTDEFFAAIRSCYNRRAEDKQYERLTFCLLGVAMPTDLIQDTRITPFNIGRRIELHDFTEAEAAPLAHGLETTLGNRANATQALQRILHWTNGHPYLTQRLCHAVAAAGAGAAADAGVPALIDRLCDELFLTSRAREQDDNLLFVRERLLRSEADLAGLLELYDRVRRGRRSVPDAATDPRVSILRLAGIVRTEHGELKIRNRVYGVVFDEIWVETNMPGAERRRQREAYRRGVVRATSVAAAVVLALAALAFYAQYQAAEAKRTRQSLSTVTVRALLSQARLGRASGQAGRRFDGLEAVKLAAAIRPGQAVRDEAIACLALVDLRLATNRSVRMDESATAVAFNRDFSRVAIGNRRGEILVRSMSHEVTTVRWPGFDWPVRQLWFSPVEGHLAVAHAGSNAHLLTLWKLAESPRAILSLTNDGALAFDLSPTTPWAAFAVRDHSGGAVHLFDLEAGTDHKLSSSDTPPRRLRFSQDGQSLAVAYEDSLKIEVRAAADGKLLRTLIAPEIAEALVWTGEGARLVAGCRDGGIYLWEIATGQRRDLRGHKGPVTSLAFAHGRSLLASASADHTVRLWQPHREGGPVVTFEGAEGWASLQFSEDNRRLGARVAGGKIEWFDVAPGVEWRELYDERATALAEIDISPDGRLLASAAENGVSLWGLPSGTRHCLLELGRGESVVFNPAGGGLIASDLKGVQTVPVRPLEGNGGGLLVGPAVGLNAPEEVGRLAYAADGRTLAMISSNRILLWDGLQHTLKSELPRTEGCRAVTLSSNALWVAAANWTAGEVWVWDTTTSNRVATLPVGGPAHVAFSPTGSWLATATAREARLWRVGSWQPGHVSRPSTGSGAAPTTFSHDGAMWAVAGADGTMALLDPASGMEIAKLEGPDRERFVSLRFSRDGSWLTAATEGRSIQVWDLLALRRGLAALGLDWSMPPLPARAAETGPLVVSNAVGWFVNRSQLSEANRRQRVAMLTGEMDRLGATAERLRRRAAEHNSLGHHAEAVADWREGLRLDPQNTTLLRELAWFHLTGPAAFRDYAAARTLAAQAVALEPSRAENQLRLGLAHIRLADYTNALPHLQRATALRKDWRASFSQFYEAVCHAKLGHAEDAVASYAKAVEGATREADSAGERAMWAAAREEAQRALEEMR